MRWPSAGLEVTARWLEGQGFAFSLKDADLLRKRLTSAYDLYRLHNHVMRCEPPVLQLGCGRGSGLLLAELRTD